MSLPGLLCPQLEALKTSDKNSLWICRLKVSAKTLFLLASSENWLWLKLVRTIWCLLRLRARPLHKWKQTHQMLRLNQATQSCLVDLKNKLMTWSYRILPKTNSYLTKISKSGRYVSLCQELNSLPCLKTSKTSLKTWENSSGSWWIKLNQSGCNSCKRKSENSSPKTQSKQLQKFQKTQNTLNACGLFLFLTSRMTSK